MLSIILTLALAGVAYGLPAEVEKRTTPDPSEVYINSIVYGGSGCPQGSLGSFISADRQTFTLEFDDYVASIGPGVAITESRKNCQLNIDLEYPQGFQYSILSTIYRGYIGIDTGITASQGSTFYFSGEASQVSTGTTWHGPVDGDYEVVDDLPLTSVIWSPCGAPIALNIDSQVLLQSSVASATGQITDDSVDGKISFIVGVQWQSC